MGVHNLSPGMVLTDLLLRDASPAARRFFNTLAEEPETVAATLVPRMRAVQVRRFLPSTSCIWRRRPRFSGSWLQERPAPCRLLVPFLHDAMIVPGSRRRVQQGAGKTVAVLGRPFSDWSCMRAQGSGSSIGYLTPLSSFGRVLLGVPQIISGGRFFDKEGNRVRTGDAQYQDNGVRLPYVRRERREEESLAPAGRR